MALLLVASGEFCGWWVKAARLWLRGSGGMWGINPAMPAIYAADSNRIPHAMHQSFRFHSHSAGGYMAVTAQTWGSLSALRVQLFVV